MGIEIDLERDSLLGEVSRKRLRESYMKEEEQSPQERFATVAETFASNPAHAQRIYDYASKHWLSFSTPILSFGRSKKGLPISCFEVYMQDTAEGLVNTLSEVNWLSMLGGGVGIHVDIRSADDKSVGVMPHLKSMMQLALLTVRAELAVDLMQLFLMWIIPTSFNSWKCVSRRVTRT